MRNALLAATALVGALAFLPATARAQDASGPLAHNFDLTFEGGYSIGASSDNALAEDDTGKLSGFSNLPPGDDGFRFAIKGEFYLDPTWSIIGGLETENLESEDSGFTCLIVCIGEQRPASFSNDLHMNSMDLAAAYRVSENLQLYGGVRGVLQSNQIQLSANDGSYLYNALAEDNSDKLSGFSNLPPGDDGFRFAIKGEFYLDPTWSIIGGLQTENLESEDSGFTCANWYVTCGLLTPPADFRPSSFSNDLHMNSLDIAAAYRVNENLQLYGGLRGILQSNQIQLSANDGSYLYNANDHLWGIGPLAGARGQMMLGDGFSIKAEIAGSALFGHRRGDIDKLGASDYGPQESSASYDDAETIYMLGGNAALHYQVNDSLDFAVGYGVQQTWNSAGKFDADKVGEHKIEDQPFGSSDILTHGPFVQVNLTF